MTTVVRVPIVGIAGIRTAQGQRDWTREGSVGDVVQRVHRLLGISHAESAVIDPVTHLLRAVQATYFGRPMRDLSGKKRGRQLDDMV